MSNINQNNFVAFLKFLEGKYPQINFSSEKLSALKNLDNQQISQYLQLLYEKFSLDNSTEEAAFVAFVKESERPKASFFAPEVIEELPRPTPAPSIERVLPKPVTPISVPLPKQARTVNIDSPNHTTRNIVLILLLGMLSYVIYQFFEYQKLGSAYALSNELVIRNAPQKDGKVLGSADLFGKNMDKNNVEIPTTSELKLYSNELQGGYYKVIVGGTPFFSYLFGTNVGYVYSKFFTTDRAEQIRYQTIFEPIKNDYYELKHLEFAYRSMIVNAIRNTPTIATLVLKESCDLQPVTAQKMPLRIGQHQNKDRTVFHALVQLSDNNYYSIIANGFYNVSQVSQVFIDNEPMTEQGKFQNKGKYFTWENCDNSTIATSGKQPFDDFKTPKYMMSDSAAIVEFFK